ncbi:MAG: Mrp/NBP35 family ATP-binding protein [Clostridia bacterium]|nr:Mrp/NBP35 family ATP-binding protein [Clostridia bacterium]
MSECSHNCESCTANCSSKEPESFLKAPHDLSKIKKVIGVVSGKGGVGKSLVCGLLSVLSQKSGYKTGILDADITGPSIPKMFGVSERPKCNAAGLFPVASKGGVSVMSLNLLLENQTDPVVWRGPVIGGTVTQFWTDVIWEDIDFMFIDMPPGTGDVPLTVFQSIPVDGIVVVTSPQELVSMIVEKAVNMAEMMKIPVLGLVENMSYVSCPDCQKQIKVFGDSHIEEIAKKHNLPVIGKIPMEPALAAACDRGDIEAIDPVWISGIKDILKELIAK